MKTEKLLITFAIALVVFITGCKKDTFVEPVMVCPLVVSTNPINSAINIPLGQVITITFNEKMDPSTINQSTITLQGGPSKILKQISNKGLRKDFSTMQSSSAVLGTVTYNNLTATFTPSSPLTAKTTYTGKISTSVKDLNGNALQVNYAWSFSTGEVISPMIVATNPLNNAIGVALNEVITASFSMPMNPSTINAASFTLKQDATTILGVVSYTDSTATFTLSSNLLQGTVYTATISKEAKSTTGIALENDYVWMFTTGVIIAPTVTSTNPVNNETNVNLNKIIIAKFSEPMDPLTINSSSFIVKQGATVVAGIISYTDTIATFTPTNNFTASAIYTATINTSAKNISGTPLANDYVWSFTTIANIAPTVISTNPINNATGVVLNKKVLANFSVPMNPLTLNTSTFMLKQGLTSIAGVVSYSGTTAMFTPSSDLLPGVVYTASITTDVKNESDIPMANNYVWSFTTGVVIAPTVISTDPVDNATGIALNKIITANFSESMNPLTLSTSTVTLKHGTTSVLGTVSYAGTTVSFTPSSDLLSGTVYTVMISSAAENIAGTALANDYVWNFTTVNIVAPTVTLTDPLNNETNVAVNKILTANFSVAMNPLTITNSTFTLKQGATFINGTVSYAGTTASFTPTINLLNGTTYTATITTGAENIAGTPITTNYIWTFTTINAVAPTVTLTDPLNNATNVAINKILSANFSVAMDPLTITSSTFTLKNGAISVGGTVSYSGTTATFNPTSNLLNGTTYTATITTGAKNTLGTPLANNYTWSFTTLNDVAPTVINTNPLNNSFGVVLTKKITADFSVAMDPLTITSSTFTVKNGATLVAGTVSYSGISATFTPTSNLLSGTTYTATITTGAKNTLGTPLANNYVWNFTTVAPLGPNIVVLNTVARFGIIAGVGVSNNAGFSEIHDLDVGISPGVRSSVTGFPPAIIVNGAIYASDDIAPPGVAAMLIQAKQDLTDAYLFAEAASTPAPITVAGDQGGLTLAPGIYKSTSTLLIQSGNLTLDAQGDVNAVWIFQVASDFTTVGGAGGNIILSGGAQAKNVFWQVGSSVVIGDFTIFKGNILALTSITMNSGAVAEGRMLVRNGAVVMTSSNKITKP